MKKSELIKCFFLLIISFYYVACSSEPSGKKRVYMSVRLASYIDGLYRMDSRIEEGTLCYYTSEEGERFYADSCNNSSGVKVFSNPNDLIIESRKVVEKSCSGVAKLVGQETTNEYTGTTPVSCGSTKIGNSVRTNCYGGDANYNSVLRSYYRCEPNTQSASINKRELPDKDKKFLDDMLQSGKINQKQYDNILHGADFATDVENIQTEPVKEESIDLFLDN